MVSESQKVRSSLAGWFWLSVSHQVAVTMPAWAVVSSEGSSGAGASLPAWLTFVAVGRGPQFLFMELYEKTLDMATGSLQSDWRESKAFFDLVSEATHHHFCHILFIGSESLSTRGR